MKRRREGETKRRTREDPKDCPRSCLLIPSSTLALFYPNFRFDVNAERSPQEAALELGQLGGVWKRGDLDPERRGSHP